MTITVEVCVDSVRSLQAAVSGGADRIELCSALALGGLTPSDGFMRLAAATGVSTYAMIRPRGGGFDYSPDEIALMEEDIRRARHHGLAGVVFGATAGGSLDSRAMARLRDAAGPMGSTLHRAFDLLDDPLPAVDAAVDAGFDRILTSGGAPTAEAGIEALRALVERAGNRLSIMAGSGIRADNVESIVKQAGVREIHGSFAVKAPHRAEPDRFGFGEDPSVPDPETIRKVKRAIAAL